MACATDKKICTAAPGMRYEAGDHVAVFGENLPEVVERACAALGHSPTTLFSIALPDPNPGMLDPPFPSPTTLRSALTHHCELQQPPDREALKALASLATDAAEAATLLQIASTEGGNDLSATSASGTSYASYIAAAQRSILDVLQVRTRCHQCMWFCLHTNYAIHLIFYLLRPSEWYVSMLCQHERQK